MGTESGTSLPTLYHLARYHSNNDPASTDFELTISLCQFVSKMQRLDLFHQLIVDSCMKKIKLWLSPRRSLQVFFLVVRFFKLTNYLLERSSLLRKEANRSLKACLSVVLEHPTQSRQSK